MTTPDNLDDLRDECADAILNVFNRTRRELRSEATPAEVTQPTTEMPSEPGMYWAVTATVLCAGPINRSGIYNAVALVTRDGLVLRAVTYSFVYGTLEPLCHPLPSDTLYGPRIGVPDVGPESEQE